MTPRKMERRFSISTTCEGYEVVDRDGRPVSNSYDYANVPLDIAARLNEAAKHGSKSLARALACVEGQETGVPEEPVDA